MKRKRRKPTTLTAYTPDPRLQQLASETARKIKAVANQRNAEIEQIYRDFRTQADAITGISDSLDTCADSQSHPQRIEH